MEKRENKLEKLESIDIHQTAHFPTFCDKHLEYIYDQLMYIQHNYDQSHCSQKCWLVEVITIRNKLKQPIIRMESRLRAWRTVKKARHLGHEDMSEEKDTIKFRSVKLMP